MAWVFPASYVIIVCIVDCQKALQYFTKKNLRSFHVKLTIEKGQLCLLPGNKQGFRPFFRAPSHKDSSRVFPAFLRCCKDQLMPGFGHYLITRSPKKQYRHLAQEPTIWKTHILPLYHVYHVYHVWTLKMQELWGLSVEIPIVHICDNIQLQHIRHRKFFTTQEVDLLNQHKTGECCWLKESRFFWGVEDRKNIESTLQLHSGWRKAPKDSMIQS